MPATKLRTEALSVWLGGTRVLHGIDLGIPDRAITVLTGPSGCGKSTFLRALNRMHDLQPGARVRGQILLDGTDTRRIAPERLRSRVGMVFQRPNPFPGSIFANVAFGPSLAGVRGRDLERIVTDSLQRAALWSEVKHRLGADARALSGGQQQRLCIARALALEPEVLLLDEPCSALDQRAAAAIEDLMLMLRREIALVLVTHSPEQARRTADVHAEFAAGRIQRLLGPQIDN